MLSNRRQAEFSQDIARSTNCLQQLARESVRCPGRVPRTKNNYHCHFPVTSKFALPIRGLAKSQPRAPPLPIPRRLVSIAEGTAAQRVLPPRRKLGTSMQNHVARVTPFDVYFWRNPETWPHDPPGYVFLARAFDDIGRAKYGARWVESPTEPEEPEDPPDDADDTAWQQNELAYEQYERARDQANADFLRMRAEVARIIAHQCEVGNLITAVRPKSGGDMVELEPHSWNTENFGSRFSRCDMSLNDPFSNSRLHRSHWIYLTRDSLDKYLGKKPAVDEGAELDKSAESTQAGEDSITQPMSTTRMPTETEIEATIRERCPYPTAIPNDNDAYHLVKKSWPKVRRQRVRDVLKKTDLGSRQRKAGERAG
jgi:hypothetical protein